MRAQRTSVASQSLTTELSSPPTYWMGLRTSGSSGSSRGYTDCTGTVTEYRGQRVACAGPCRAGKTAAGFTEKPALPVEPPGIVGKPRNPNTLAGNGVTSELL